MQTFLNEWHIVKKMERKLIVFFSNLKNEINTNSITLTFLYFIKLN